VAIVGLNGAGPVGGQKTTAHDVGISPQEDRGGAAGAVGEGEGGEEGIDGLMKRFAVNDARNSR
jgi:hypothetical protein